MDEMKENYEQVQARIKKIGGEAWYEKILCCRELETDTEKKISCFFSTLHELMNGLHTVSEEVKIGCFEAVSHLLMLVLDEYEMENGAKK